MGSPFFALAPLFQDTRSAPNLDRTYSPFLAVSNDFSSGWYLRVIIDTRTIYGFYAFTVQKHASIGTVTAWHALRITSQDCFRFIITVIAFIWADLATLLIGRTVFTLQTFAMKTTKKCNKIKNLPFSVMIFSKMFSNLISNGKYN